MTVPIAQGSIFGEVGLISGRKRGATVRAAEGAIVVEIPRNAALKLMATVPRGQARDHPHLDRAAAAADVRLGRDPRGSDRGARQRRDRRSQARARRSSRKARKAYDIFVIRQGSMVVEKEHRRQAGVPLLPSGRLLCRRDGADRRRPAHRDGARRDQVRSDQARRRRASAAARGASPSCSRRFKTRHGARATSSTASSRPQGRLRRRRRHVFDRSPASWSTTASARRPTCC